MRYEDILNNLRNKVYHPVYFLMGEESYYIDQITDYITQNVLNEDEKDFNQHILYGKETSVHAIISLSRRFPMMAKHQVIVVKEAQNIKKIEELELYVNQPLKSTILVVNHKYKSLDKRKKFTRLLADKAVLLESKKLYENQIPDWIENYLIKSKLRVEPQAAAMLAEYLGTDLSKVANELDKLLIAFPEHEIITPRHVEENIGISKDFNIFELQNALGEKNILKSNQIINYFQSNPSTNPITRTISSLYFFFMKLLTYHFLKDKSINSVASNLKINRYFVRSYIAASKNYSIRKIIGIIEILREYDMKSKGYGNVSVSQGDLQRELIYKILH